MNNIHGKYITISEDDIDFNLITCKYLLIQQYTRQKDVPNHYHNLLFHYIILIINFKNNCIFIYFTNYNS